MAARSVGATTQPEINCCMKSGYAGRCAMWGGNEANPAHNHSIEGEVWKLLVHSRAYVAACGFDRRWFLQNIVGTNSIDVMDIARRPDGSWWLVHRYLSDIPPEDHEIIGPFKSGDDARAAMWMLAATES